MGCNLGSSGITSALEDMSGTFPICWEWSVGSCWYLFIWICLLDRHGDCTENTSLISCEYTILPWENVSLRFWNVRPLLVLMKSRTPWQYSKWRYWWYCSQFMPWVIVGSGVKLLTSTIPSLPFNRKQRIKASISLFRHSLKSSSVHPPYRSPVQ